MSSINFAGGTIVPASWLNDVNGATYNGSGVYTPAGIGAVATTVQTKLRESVSVKDFGAVGDGVADDTTALASAVTYVNSFSLAAKPIGLLFPNGTYKSSATLAFTRPVYIYANGDAVLNYTGSGSSAIKLGQDGITGFNVFLQGEYTVDGLRFTGGTNAVYGIYLNDYVIEPRIRNCTFEDYGNSTCYDIFGQFQTWDVVIENCRKFTYSSVTAVGNFISISGRNKANTAYDGGNSRVTISDCWMTSYSNQEMGLFAYVNATQSRIIGGGFQHSNGGIAIGPVANATVIDGVYAEISSSTAPTYISVYGTTDGGLSSAQNVKVLNGYVNMHQEVIGSNGRLIATKDTNVRLIGWHVENMTIANFLNGQVLVVQNDVTGQTGNSYKNIKPMWVPLSANDGRTFAIRGSYTNAEAWALEDVETGTWTPNQGSGLTVVGAFSSSGTYTKVGRQVTVQGAVSGATSVAVSSGGQVCTNLPFTALTTFVGNFINGAGSAGGQNFVVSSNTLISATAMSASTGYIFTMTYFV